MSRISDKNIFLIDGEYISHKIKIRAVYYITLLIIVLTFISVSFYQFSVNFSFEGSISQASMVNSSDSTHIQANKVVEIQLNQALSNLFKNCKNIQIELLEGNIPIYRCEGEIIHYSTLPNTDKQNSYNAHIAKTTDEDQIELFPADLPSNCRAEITIKDVRISLDNLLHFITLKDLFSIEINQFS